MRAPHLVDLALLAEHEAERRHFDARNFRKARVAWFLLFAISLGGLSASLAAGLRLQTVLVVANLAALVAVALARRALFLHRSFAPALIAALAVESVLFTALPTVEPLSLAYAFVVVPFFFLLFRLRFLEEAGIVALVVATIAARGLLPSPAPAVEGEEMPRLVAIVTVAALLLGAAAVGATITRRQRAELLSDLARARGDARDRLRMREELESARAIQLAMLPRCPPSPGWLELAAVCTPATEVGGDYYDYFELAPDRLVVAIGDVAGHGVASGIVLSGVRAGLHLLAEQLDRPAEALDRLNRLVRETGPERLLMSLGLALFEPSQGRLSWSSAGQPPALRWVAATGATETHHGAQPPLGTRLPVRYASVQAPLAPGDVWLFVSDGLAEARSAAGEPFGEARLAEALRAAASEGLGAEAVRDRILVAVDRHRDGAAPEDDLTLVVARRVAG